MFLGWVTSSAISASVMRSGRSVVMTRVERVCSGSNQCVSFSSCTALQGRNKQDTLETIRYTALLKFLEYLNELAFSGELDLNDFFLFRQLQCGFSGSSPLVCCPPSLPRKAVEGGGNPAINVDGNVNVNVNSRTDLDIGGLNARTGNFPQEETTLWSEEFGPK